jgi:ubiquinone/menaquinone biosynthesis C-methylase UbiE
MDAPEQARAYAEADFAESNRLFVAHVVTLVDGIRSGTLIDLGCGPADICIRLARALPGWRMVGLDAGPNMLALAREAVSSAGLETQISLILAHLPGGLPEQRFDAICSNSLLHHLPDPMSLWQSIRKLAGPGSAIQVMDLHRPATEASAAAIVDTHAGGAPDVLREDFYNSLLAAYTTDEVEEQIRLSGLAGLAVSRPTDRHWLVQGRIDAG